MLTSFNTELALGMLAPLKSLKKNQEPRVQRAGKRKGRGWGNRSSEEPHPSGKVSKADLPSVPGTRRSRASRSPRTPPRLRTAASPDSHLCAISRRGYYYFTRTLHNDK